jgi:pyruvate dehydrogenase E1 component alpha subunit
VVAFFGDGATEEGVFHESLNFAALHKLPVLLVCENNFYAIHEPIEKRWATRQLCERVRTYGIPASMIANGDVFEILPQAAQAIAHMRAGGGPAFLECQTYRWREHVGPNEDFAAGYRPRSEMDPWLEADQLHIVGAQLSPGVRERMDAEIEVAIASAFAFAESSRFPDARDLLQDVFA